MSATPILYTLEEHRRKYRPPQWRVTLYRPGAEPGRLNTLHGAPAAFWTPDQARAYMAARWPQAVEIEAPSTYGD